MGNAKDMGEKDQLVLRIKKTVRNHYINHKLLHFGKTSIHNQQLTLGLDIHYTTLHFINSLRSKKIKWEKQMAASAKYNAL